MRIAVCLSGQPRTIEAAIPNILKYFSGEHEYDFFCHTWDYNTYKRRNKNAANNEQPVYWEGDVPVDRNWLHEQVKRFSPKHYIIDSAEVIGAGFSWASLTYSLMMANHLKKRYEIENNFRYDLVVRSRYDIIFEPTHNFYAIPLVMKPQYLDIVCVHAGRMTYEFNRVNVSDQFFYGSSTAMDLISDLYRKIQKHQVRQDDYDLIGPGAFISDHTEERNLKVHTDWSNIQSTVFRPEVADIDSLTQLGYQQINNYSQTFYKL